MNHRFEIRRTVELPATPEQIWQAVATGSGHQAWLFPSGGDTPGAVGDTIMDHRVEAFDPPRHFRAHLEGEDGFFNTLEYLIEGRNGGTSVLRYMHSGILVEDWENQYDAADKHTDFYLHTLGQYLEHFTGREATYIGAEGPAASSAPEAFDALQRQLGVEQAAEGEPVTGRFLASNRSRASSTTGDRRFSASGARTGSTDSSAETPSVCRWAGSSPLQRRRCRSAAARLVGLAERRVRRCLTRTLPRWWPGSGPPAAFRRGRGGTADRRGVVGRSSSNGGRPTGLRPTTGTGLGLGRVLWPAHRRRAGSLRAAPADGVPGRPGVGAGRAAPGRRRSVLRLRSGRRRTRRSAGRLEIWAADIDPAAVRCARRNLPHDQVFEGDLYAALPTALAGRIDLLVVNAPYVPTDAIR